MQEVEKRALTDSQSYEGAIEVINPKGKALQRTWHFWREGNRGQSKMRIRFDAPEDVRGLSLLCVQTPNAPAAQWLYTPSNQRVRRLASQEKSQRFLGTDLSYEDIEEHPVEEYDYKIVGEEDLAGQSVYKIRAAAKNPNNTQYSSMVLHVRKDILATTFIEFYVAGKLRKTMLRGEWQQIRETWTPLLVEVKDLARGSMTRIHSSNVQYHVEFDPQWFTPANLSKAP
jgi:outer membrane lipoprotein-sorting protein